jgi:hypothetical protein
MQRVVAVVIVRELRALGYVVVPLAKVTQCH